MKKILIGKILSAFGIKGEVKLVSFCENPLQIEKYPLVDEKNSPIKIKISNKNKAVIGSTLGGAILIAKVDGITDRTAAEKIHNKEIFVNRDDLKNLKADEFYYSDLIGLNVVDMNSKKIGKVISVEDHGAGGIIEIEFSKDKKIENFSFKNEIFPEVNLEENFIRIEMPEVVEIK